MAGCGKVIVNQLIENNIVNFYIRYVDDTVLVLRKKDIDIVLNKFNIFNKNLKFSVNTFIKIVCPIFWTWRFVPVDSLYIIKMPKLVSAQILNLLHCGNGKHRG